MVKLGFIERQIGLVFRDKNLLKQALTHVSYLNDNPGWAFGHNERLEFIGDSVLGLIVTEYLFREFPKMPNGQMFELRSALVKNTMISKVGYEIRLRNHVLLSRTQQKEGEHVLRQIVADAFEALIGALHLDQGLSAARSFLSKVLLKHAPEMLADGSYRDPRTILQEEAVKHLGEAPRYEIVCGGVHGSPDRFTSAVFIGDDMVAKGSGWSKLISRERAAQEALRIKGWS